MKQEQTFDEGADNETGTGINFEEETKPGDAYNHEEQDEKVDAEKFDITKMRKE